MMIWSRQSAGAPPVTVTVPDRAALMADLRACLAEGRGFSVATLNLDHVVKLGRDPAFHAAYAAQTHVTADGNPIVWLSRLAGQREVALVPGSELIGPLAALAAEAGVTVALFGATEASLAQAATALEARYPGRGEARAFHEFLAAHPEWQAVHWRSYATFCNAFILVRR